MLARRRCGELIRLSVWKDLRSDNVNSLKPSARWARVALKLLVADCPYRPVLCISPGNPFTDRQIAKNIRVGYQLWQETKAALIKWGEIEMIPGIGIKVLDWRGLVGTQFETRAKAKEVAPASEKELEVSEFVRGRLIETYNTICGSAHLPNEHNFVKNVAGRMAEGATEQDLDIGMRTYIWAYQNATPSLLNQMAPFQSLQGHSFWKWRKMNRPAPVLRMFSTIEYVRSLSPKLKKIARGYSFGYHSEMKLILRKNGWDHLYDVDFDKVMTCKQYVQTRIAQEGSFDTIDTDV